MSAALHTLRVLVGVPSLALFSAALILIVLLPTREFAVVALLPVCVASFIGVLTLRISRIAEAGVWRLLPQGRRAMIRAAALLVLSISVLLGMAWMSATSNITRFVPLFPVLTLFIHFSLLALPLVLRTGERRPRFMVITYLVVCLLIFQLVSARTGLHHVPWFWYGASASFAAIWLVACFGKPPALLAKALRRWLSNVERQSLPSFARLNPRFAIGLPPATAVLRTRHSNAWLGLPVAGFVLLVWALYWHQFIRTSTLVDGFRQAVGGQSWIISAVMLVLTQRYAASARALWLRWGDSRAQIFRLVERNFLYDLLILGTLGWLAPTLLGALRGLVILPGPTFKLWVACICVGLLPGYLGLLWSTCHALWQRALVIVPMAASMSFLNTWWATGLGLMRGGERPVDWMRIGILVLIFVVARVVTAWRWNTIDWTHFRSTRRKK